MRKPFLREDKRFWSSIAISSGLVIFFFGISLTEAGLTTWFGIALLIIGFSILLLRKSKEGSSQQNSKSIANSGIKMTDVEYKSCLIEERKTLVSSLREQARSFDRHILALAGGTFGLSIFIIKVIAPSPVADSMPYLMGAWISFAISITLTLASFLLSQKACLRNIELIDARLSGTSSSQKYESANIFAKLTMIFNWLSICAFIIGVILLINFGYQNLPVA